MTKPDIPIANIYYLLCYALDRVKEGEIVRVSELQQLHTIRDLLGKILAEGTFHLLRAGLDRGYLDVQENLSGVRGKIEIGSTIKRALRSRGQVTCRYQELSHDVLHNRILRSTLRTLIRKNDLNKGVRSNIRHAYEKFNDVSLVALNRGVFQQVRLDRNRRFYWFLMSVCRLIYEELLIAEEHGQTRFQKFNEKQMFKLFEDFIGGFYRREQETFEVIQNSKLNWITEGTAEDQKKWIPEMKADVILESPDRRIIIDAKYYKDGALVSHYGNLKLRSDHLFQLLAYLRNLRAQEQGPQHEGMLLYATVDKKISIDICLEGFLIKVRSIDLNQDWRLIHEDMIELLN